METINWRKKKSTEWKKIFDSYLFDIASYLKYVDN